MNYRLLLKSARGHINIRYSSKEHFVLRKNNHKDDKLLSSFIMIHFEVSLLMIRSKTVTNVSTFLIKRSYIPPFSHISEHCGGTL